MSNTRHIFNCLCGTPKKRIIVSTITGAIGFGLMAAINHFTMECFLENKMELDLGNAAHCPTSLPGLSFAEESYQQFFCFFQLPVTMAMGALFCLMKEIMTNKGRDHQNHMLPFVFENPMPDDLEIDDGRPEGMPFEPVRLHPARR